ncbi:MarR family winged helix-turn-helix transcriptional regulator [Actinomadura scrupuli]|uniref:MarR family winged helix-turn-helix transcriptional regulator n=1 Tax=Actinomadura scrupuli TaxID=559629 RepID=UPI003D980C73
MSDRESSHPCPGLETWHTGRLLTAAARMVEHAFDTGVAELGVTHAGVNVLAALTGGPLTQRELAARCQVQDQTMSRLIDGLERSGYAVRRRDPGDRRRVLVERTSTGGDVMKRASEVGARFGFLDDGSAENAACRDLLIKIITRLGGERKDCPGTF